jgi:hypothetical protein
MIKSNGSLTKSDEIAQYLDKQRQNSITEMNDSISDFFDDAKNKCKNFVENTGWVISPNLPFPTITKILDLNDKTELESNLLRIYEDNDNEMIKELFKSIRKSLENSNYDKWKLLISSCIDIYDNGYFTPVLPSLVSVIEGIIGCEENITKYFRVKLKEYCLQKSHVSEEYDKYRDGKDLIWLSIAYYIDAVFKKAEFGQERSLIINRHWIQHGRDDCNLWRKIDAINLFCAVDALMWAKLPLEEESLEK